MKKIICFLIIPVIVILIILGVLLGKGFGMGKGEGKGEETGNASNLSSTVLQEETQSENEAESFPTEVTAEEDEKNKSRIILNITVAEDEYFYENKSIELKEFVDILEKIEGEVMVKVTDDNATLKAYNKLIDQLEKMEISYAE